MTEQHEYDAIYVRDVVAIVLRRWWVIVLATAIAVGLVSVWMYVVEPKYTAEMTVAPVGAETDQNLGALVAVARFTGFGERATEEVPKYIRFQQTIFSTVLAERLQERYRVMQKVFEERWDTATQSWLPPTGLLDKVRAIIDPWFGLPAWSNPSPKTLVEYLKEEISISEVADTAMLKFSYSHKDPKFAVNLLNWLYGEADEFLRAEAREAAERQVAFASERLASITVSDYRTMMLALLAEEEKKLLLIEAAGPYTALVVDPPTVSDQPTFPRPVIFLLATTLVGIAFGVALIFIWRAFVSPLEQRSAPMAVPTPVTDVAPKREAS